MVLKTAVGDEGDFVSTELEDGVETIIAAIEAATQVKTYLSDLDCASSDKFYDKEIAKFTITLN